ncbi:MAG: metallophosphoesterase [Clostridia bacterium]|nr:metallophosphoesterase [Clostridia bacterium]
MTTAEKKPVLRFNKNGRFRILMMSDVQEHQDYDRRTPEGMRAMIGYANPDLVILGGDNADGRKLKTEKELREYLRVFTLPMEEKLIPWMHIFGNHDYDIDVSPRRQSLIYSSYPHCVSGISPRGVEGVSNYCVPILSSNGDSTAYVIYAFDTRYKGREYRPGIGTDQLVLPGNGTCCRKWDGLTFNQIAWYVRRSREFEKREGRPVRAMAVMHVPPYEFDRVVRNPEICGTEGFTDQGLHSSMVNSGVFAAMLERGDVEIIAAGHLHKDTFSGEYGGILCALDGCAGYSPSNFDERRGGRIFDIFEAGGRSTEFVPVDPLINKAK